MANMLNRLIYGGEVYYKVNDLVELYKVSLYKIKKAIKTQEIQTKTLEGFGRSLFISENNVRMLEIDGTVTYMETEVKCYRDEFQTTGFITMMAHGFTNQEINQEQLLKEVHEKVTENMDKFASKVEQYDEKEIAKANEQKEIFNSFAEQFGYSNRVHVANILVNGEIRTVKFATVNNEITDSDIWYPVEFSTVGSLYRDFERAHFQIDEVEIFPTKGESTLTDVEAFNMLLEKVHNSKCKVDVEQENELLDENNMRILDTDLYHEAEVYVALLKGNFKYIKQRPTTDDEITDADFEELLI